MHYDIFQLSKIPVKQDEYISADKISNVDDFFSWADYIGDEREGDIRKECIVSLAKRTNGVFSLNDDYSLTYNGEEALRAFLTEWAENLRELTAKLNADNILTEMNLYKIKDRCDRTHVEDWCRYYIEEWNGYAAPFCDVFGWARCCLKEGDRVYIGAVYDFHC